MTTAVRAPAFMESLIEKLVPTTSCTNVIENRDYLRKRIVHFIDIYSRDNSLSAVAFSITDSTRGLFKKSEWDSMRSTLKFYSGLAITDHFILQEKSEILESKAEALSAFLLRYLIDDARTSKGYFCKFIDKKEWDSEKMGSLAAEEIIERGIYWNGIRLPKQTIKDLLDLISVEINLIKQKIQNVNVFFGAKPTIEWLKRFELQDLSNLTLDEINLSLSELLQSLIPYEELVKVKFSTLQCSRNILCQNLKEIRKAKSAFAKTSEQWQMLYSPLTINNSAELVNDLIRFFWERLNVWSAKLDSLAEKIPDNNFEMSDIFNPENMKPLQRINQLRNQIVADLNTYRWVCDLNSKNFKQMNTDQLIKIVKNIAERLRQSHEMEKFAIEEIKTVVRSNNSSQFSNNRFYDAKSR